MLLTGGPTHHLLLHTHITATAGEFHALVIVFGFKGQEAGLCFCQTLGLCGEPSLGISPQFRFFSLQQRALLQPVLVWMNVLLVLKYGTGVCSTDRRSMTSGLNAIRAAFHKIINVTLFLLTWVSER